MIGINRKPINLLLILQTLLLSQNNANEDGHPDPNNENYEGMIYVGKMEGDRRLGFDEQNEIRYLFGTGFDDFHKAQEEEDLHQKHFGALAGLDVADRAHKLKHDKDLKERLHKMRHGEVKAEPKPFGHVDTHELDGGVVPVKYVEVDPFFLDEAPVTNVEFSKFVRSTLYETQAEEFGWSFVLSSHVRRPDLLDNAEVDPEADNWVAIEGAYWRMPEGPGSSYKNREHHPVVHVSQKDAAEYCTWADKRLPGEWEWEAAARGRNWHATNRTLYSWGDNDSTEIGVRYMNFWQGEFPVENSALDGWKATSPVKYYPANTMGFYDMSGNVWEWMRGGKKKARILRGGSYVDSLDGSINHAATLGARATAHQTTSTANIGFRCAKSAKRRVEYHWVYHDEEIHGELNMEDEYHPHHHSPEKYWEDLYYEDYFKEDEEDIVSEADAQLGEYITEKTINEETGEVTKRKKKKVIKQRTRISTEL